MSRSPNRPRLTSTDPTATVSTSPILGGGQCGGTADECSRPSSPRPQSTNHPKSNSLRIVPVSSIPTLTSAKHSTPRLKTGGGAASRGSKYARLNAPMICTTRSTSTSTPAAPTVAGILTICPLPSAPSVPWDEDCDSICCSSASRAAFRVAAAASPNSRDSSPTPCGCCCPCPCPPAPAAPPAAALSSCSAIG